MSLARAIFAFALFTPILGATGSKFVVGALLGQSPQTVVAPGTGRIAALPTQVMVPVSTPVPPTAPPASPTTMPLTPTASATALASPTAGTATLTRYWLRKTVARVGETISVSYAIDNASGHEMSLALGVSMKASSSPSWIAAFADPAHDVTAAVAPGSSTHERFFTLPPGLAPGSYDVAWGLRDSAGQQVTVVSTAGALHIVK